MLNSLMDNIIEVLNNSDDLEESIIQFLTATPFTKFDYHNMGRLINKKNFFGSEKNYKKYMGNV